MVEFPPDNSGQSLLRMVLPLESGGSLPDPVTLTQKGVKGIRIAESSQTFYLFSYAIKDVRKFDNKSTDNQI